MKGLRIKIIIIEFQLLLVLSGACFAGGAGTTSANFLKFGIGARPIGLGEAFTAIADDVNTIYWNPAGLSNLSIYKEMSFMYNRIDENTSNEFVAFSVPSRRLKGTLGVSANLFEVGAIQGYDAQGIKTSAISASDSALTLGYGGRLFAHTSFGMNVKTISERLDTYSASAYAADIGVLYKLDYLTMAPFKNLSIGFAQQNLGTQVKFISEGAPLPSITRAGIAYKGDVLDGTLIIAADYVAPSDYDPMINMGAEYRVYDFIALRAGYSSKDDLASGLRAGFGLRIKSFDIDYAFMPRGDFGTSNRVSVTFRFGMAYDSIVTVKKINEQVERGIKSYEKGDLINAYKEFKNVLLVAPGHKKAQEYFAKTELRVEEIQTSQNMGEHLALGEEYFRNNNLGDAQAEFEAILAVAPENKVALEYLGKIKAELQRITDSLFTRGFSLYNSGEYERSIRELDKVLVFDPNHEKALEYIKLSKEKMRRIEEIKEQQIAKERERKTDKQVQALLREGAELYENKKWTEAAAKLQQALSLRPDNAQAKEYLGKLGGALSDNYLRLAREAYEKKEYETASKNLEQLLKLNPNQKEASQLAQEINGLQQKEKSAKANEYNKQGLVAYSQKNLEKAIQCWTMALKLNPNLEEAQTNLKRAQKESNKK